MNNFCALPFGHTTVQTNGDFAVCCRHYTPSQHIININKDPYEVWESSIYLNEVRQAFADNKRHPGCSACWKLEDYNQPSLRTRTQQEYKLLGIDKSITKLVNVELQVGNLCNLKCLMCYENDSSAILAENIQLGINLITQKDVNWTDTGFENLGELIHYSPTILNIRGGEPMYNKPLLTVIENLPKDVCSRTLLHITTNGTQSSPRWIAALEKFKIVRPMFSIDAVDELYEYIRFPGKWATTAANVNHMQTIKNIKPLVHCVVQNLNIGSIGPLIAWCKACNLYLQFDQIVTPDYLVFTNLPRNLKLSAVTHLELVLQWELDPHIREFITQAHIQLTDSLSAPDNLELWEIFKTQIEMRDTIRNNTHKLFLSY